MRSMVRWTAKLSSRWVEAGVAQGDVAGQRVAPGLDLLQEGVVDLGGARLALGGLGVLVERALEDGLRGEDGGDLVPALGVLARRCR